MVDSAGLISKSKVSIAISANELAGNVLIFGFFNLKSVGKVYQLETNQLREGMITRRYKRRTCKASDKFLKEVEEKLATERYTAQELQIVSHVTEKFFGKVAYVEKIKKVLKMTFPL